MVRNVSELLGSNPIKIPVDKCIAKTPAHPMAENVDALVTSIRTTNGLIHPIIVQKMDDGKYEIIVGNRRWYACNKLGMTEINAWVLNKDLTEDEKRAISFIECYGQREMKKNNYVDVIGYFYDRYGGGKDGIKDTAETLGITVEVAKKYLKEARLPQEIKDEIAAGTFTRDIALKGLLALGDDDESVDVQKWIETSNAIQKLRPSIRGKVARVMKKHPGWTREQAEEFVKELRKKKQNIVKIEMTDEQRERLEKVQKEMAIDDMDDLLQMMIDEFLIMKE